MVNIENQNLILTDDLISQAQEKGVYFGHGDPKNRIRYLIKKGLLPHQVRKTENGKINAYIDTSALAKLLEIENLQTEHKLTIPKIIKHLSRAITGIANNNDTTKTNPKAFFRLTLFQNIINLSFI